MSVRARLTIRTTTGKRVRSRRKVSVRRTPLQRDVLRDVMLSAAECDTWMTLEELARMTSYPPASISARVADFALAGQAALDGPEHASRMVMFRLFI